VDEGTCQRNYQTSKRGSRLLQGLAAWLQEEQVSVFCALPHTSGQRDHLGAVIQVNLQFRYHTEQRQLPVGRELHQKSRFGVLCRG
jgi:hypothetical protein